MQLVIKNRFKKYVITSYSIHYTKLYEFAGLEFQKSVERLCFELNGHTQFAPAQRLTDFVAGKRSADLPESSYKPGLIASPLHEKLPKRIASRLREGILMIDKKSRGFHSSYNFV